MDATCPKCQHQFDAGPRPAVSMKTVSGLDKELSADALAFCTLPTVQPATADGYQFLVAVAEASMIQMHIHDDAFELDLARQVKRLAHAYNRCVQEGWVKKGIFSVPVRVPLAQLSPRYCELIGIFPRTDLSREELNERLGFPIFHKEGEYAGREPWDAYAAANGLE